MTSEWYLESFVQKSPHFSNKSCNRLIKNSKMFTVAVFLGLVVVASARPQYVQMFQIVPAMSAHEEQMTPVRLFKSLSAKTSYEPYHETWEQFKIKHGKSYESREIEEGRKAIFMENVKMIELHNVKFNNREKNFFLDINQFADMTNEEFRAFNGFVKLPKAHRGCSRFLGFSGIELPTSVDWRKHGYVTPVKNQKQCGSCWSFSTTGSLEGQNFRKTGKLISLSEQQLVDCSGSYGNQGCNGGLMDNAFSYIKAKGIETEENYPYIAKQNRCKYEPSKVVAKDTGCMDISSESESDLKNAVGTVGPVSVAIDASHSSFQFYKSGVYDEPDCSSSELDHGVLVVGYGTLEGQDYWLVKNSWATVWGDEGYIYMSRNKDNQCGIASSASYPLV